MQSWINAQRRYCAGPRLDCARDASLEHQQNHGAARKQGKSTLWIFFSPFFFCAAFFFCAVFFFFAKNHYNGECLKTLLSSNWQDGHEIFFDQFFFFFTARTQKLETGQKKLPIMAPVSKHSETPKNRIARKFFEKCVFEKFWAYPIFEKN